MLTAQVSFSVLSKLLVPYFTAFWDSSLSFLTESCWITSWLVLIISSSLCFCCSLFCCVWLLPLNKTIFSLFLFCPLFIHNIFQSFLEKLSSMSLGCFCSKLLKSQRLVIDWNLNIKVTDRCSQRTTKRSYLEAYVFCFIC